MKFNPQIVHKDFRNWFKDLDVHYGVSWEEYVKSWQGYLDPIPPEYIYRVWEAGYKSGYRRGLNTGIVQGRNENQEENKP